MLSVMLVTVTRVLATSVTNVALPHMQGSLSAGPSPCHRRAYLVFAVQECLG